MLKILRDAKNTAYLKPYRPYFINPGEGKSNLKASGLNLKKEIIYAPTVILFDIVEGGYKEVFRMESLLREFHF